MKKILLLNKKEGETPLEALEVFRSKNKKYKDVKMTYAGRLDPMASGLLLVLLSEETKKKEKYLKLGKEYKFEILFGFATDTYDILGKISNSLIRANGTIEQSGLEKQIKQNLKYFKGKFLQKYPPYSSKTVKGKALFEYARSGAEVEAPAREVFVKKLKFLKLRTISHKKLLENIKKRVNNVKGDFRQKEILKIWNKKLNNSGHRVSAIGSFRIKCGGGVYVRGIVNSLGEHIGVPALAYSIKRTKIGNWR